MRNNIKKSLILSWLLTLSVSLMIGLTSCEGPEGPAGATGPQGDTGAQGPAGANGINGVDGADGSNGIDLTASACTGCHNDDVIFAKRAQLNMADHALMPNSLSRGTSSSCSQCHSHQGFRAYVQEGAGGSPAEVSGLTCKSCHTLHDDANVGNFTYDVLATDAVELLTGTGTVSFGDDLNTNLCLNCHQPRRDYTEYDSTPEDGTDSVFVTSSHAGPHYGQMGSNLFGVGADDRNGSAIAGGEMMHSTGANCVSCHMGGNASHTFAPSTSNCTSCHTGTNTFDINGAATAMEDAIHAIEAEFVNRGWYSDDGDGGIESNASSSAPLELSGADFTAFWNYNIIHADHGALYHNPPFIKAVINNIEDNLGMALTVW